VTEKATSQIIEIAQYQDKGADGFDFKLDRSSPELQTWRKDEEPMTRLESLAAAARLAYVNTLSETEIYIIANSPIGIEENDVNWLFNGIDSDYSINSDYLTQLDPWIDLYSTEQPSQIMH
jgi:hypothetical protein